MPPYFPSCLTAQTAYAQLLDAALSAEHLRSVADLPGSFASKTVKGHKYWYFQYTEPSGKLRQIFVGPDGPGGTETHGAQGRGISARATGTVGPLGDGLRCASVLPRHFRVIRRLADYGFFRPAACS